MSSWAPGGSSMLLPANTRGSRPGGAPGAGGVLAHAHAIPGLARGRLQCYRGHCLAGR